MTTPETPSPLDRLAAAVAARLKPGELGLVAARAGVGKTACLVQLALTELLAERPVLHVALDSPVRDVQGWYDRLLEEALRRGYLPGRTTLTDLRLQLERHRHIHSYLQRGFTAARLEEALALMEEVMDFRPHAVVVDGFPFEVARPDAVAALRDVARARSFRIWLSALTHRHEPEDSGTGLPQAVAPFVGTVDLVLRLGPEGERVLLTLPGAAAGTGPADAPALALDPATQLVTSI